MSGRIFVLVMTKIATGLGATPEELLLVTIRSGPDLAVTGYRSAPWPEMILDQVIPAYLDIKFVFQITHWEGE